jgi:DNA-binding beta-propeller fold protein YncE
MTTSIRTACATLFLLAIASPAFSAYEITKTLQIGGPGSWDYVTVDPSTQRLYLTRTTHTMILDAATGKLIADIPGQKRSHGVALVPRLGRGFITDGQDGSVIIFDLKTNSTLGKIPAANDADGVIYDPASDLVLVSCGDANALIPIKPDVDPKSGKAEAAIDLGGKPEFLAADGKGKAYVNLVDKAQVAVVDLKSMKLVSKWPVAPAAQPVGMAINPAKGRLYVGCRSGAMVVMDTNDGHLLANLPIGKVNDACAFDPSTGEAFASCGDGTLTVVKETSPGKFEVVQTLKTRTGAKTMGADVTKHLLYLPAVEYQPGQQQGGQGGQGGRPVAKPDSFMVLIVGAK